MARRKLSSEINVVPYIDVMLVLLIIFMVTAPLMVQGIQVDLPKTNAQSMSSQDEDIVLSVDAQGQLFLNMGDNQEQPLADQDVVERIGKIVVAQPDRLILIHGDAAAAYEHVARAMTLMQQAGALKVGFVTQPREDGSEN